MSLLAAQDEGLAGENTTAVAIPRYLRAELLRPMKSSPGRSIEVIRGISELEEIKEEWQALEDRCASKVSAFQSYEWCHAWAHVFLQQKHPPARLFVVTLRHAGHLQLIWPLMITGKTMKVLRWLSDPFAQYGDVLIDAGADKQGCLKRAWKHIREHSGADVIRLRHVPEQAAAHHFLMQNLNEAGGAHQLAPFMDLSRFQTEAEYEARYTKVQRRRRRKIRNAFERQGELSFDTADLSEQWPHIHLAKFAWMQKHGFHAKVLNVPGFDEFMLRLADVKNGPLIPVVTTMRLDGKPISWEVGFRYKDRHLAFLTAHDPDYHLMSPARLHMDLAQRRALCRDVKIYDLLVPTDPHKSSFQSGAQNVHCLYASFSLRGWVYGRGYLSIVWPLARRLYHALPDNARKWLTLAQRRPANYNERKNASKD